jgi:hypothetical protein
VPLLVIPVSFGDHDLLSSSNYVLAVIDASASLLGGLVEAFLTS